MFKLFALFVKLVFKLAFGVVMLPFRMLKLAGWITTALKWALPAGALVALGAMAAQELENRGEAVPA